jgi:hypothetical protein
VYVVIVAVEMPLETSGFTDYALGADGHVEASEVRAMGFIYYGPFESESRARGYADLVEGGVQELVAPVLA